MNPVGVHYNDMIRIISAEPLPHCRLKVTFNGGVSGIFPVATDVSGLITPETWAFL